MSKGCFFKNLISIRLSWIGYTIEKIKLVPEDYVPRKVFRFMLFGSFPHNIFLCC